MAFKMGIDLGGTTAKVVLLDANNKILDRGLIHTASDPSVPRIIRELFHLCQRIRKNRPIKHIGVGVAGVINFKTGNVGHAPNLGWKNVPLRRLLREKLGVRITVDNDATVAALGIYRTQIPASVKNVIVITLGTGIGGGLILNGKIFRGGIGTAGEIGHMIMVENGRPCKCGMRGCLEAYAGGQHIVNMVKEELKKGAESELASVFKAEPERLTPLAVAQAASNGDALAQSVWKVAGNYLGIAIGNLIYVLNPDLIFLTGGVAQAGDLILKPLWDSLNARTFEDPIRAVKIRVADKAEFIGAYGAALL